MYFKTKDRALQVYVCGSSVDGDGGDGDGDGGDGDGMYSVDYTDEMTLFTEASTVISKSRLPTGRRPRSPRLSLLLLSDQADAT